MERGRQAPLPSLRSEREAVGRLRRGGRPDNRKDRHAGGTDGRAADAEEQGRHLSLIGGVADCRICLDARARLRVVRRLPRAVAGRRSGRAVPRVVRAATAGTALPEPLAHLAVYRPATSSRQAFCDPPTSLPKRMARRRSRWLRPASCRLAPRSQDSTRGGHHRRCRRAAQRRTSLAHGDRRPNSHRGGDPGDRACRCCRASGRHLILRARPEPDSRDRRPVQATVVGDRGSRGYAPGRPRHGFVSAPMG